jgi:hypothetical protein
MQNIEWKIIANAIVKIVRIFREDSMRNIKAGTVVKIVTAVFA